MCVCVRVGLLGSSALRDDIISELIEMKCYQHAAQGGRAATLLKSAENVLSSQYMYMY